VQREVNGSPLLTCAPQSCTPPLRPLPPLPCRGYQRKLHALNKGYAYDKVG